MLESAVIDQLKTIVGDGNVGDDDVTRLSYSYDATPQYQSLPDAVVKPRHTKEVQQIVRLCRTHHIPIVPRGAGTNLCAGTVPLEGGIVLLFDHMNQIIEVDEENVCARVQPGVNTQFFIEQMEERQLFYPPDPSSMKISTLGGNISECSGGLRGLKYGVTKDYVLGLEVVLANGDVLHTGGKLAKDVAGYDLTKLLVGSEGTLGIVTEATLKLLPLPETKRTMLAWFNTMEQAAQTVSDIIAQRMIPATLEFMDQRTIQAVEAYAKLGLPTDIGAVLLIEQDGAPAIVNRDIEKIRTICEQANAVSVQVAQNDEEGQRLTTARRSALTALSRLKPTTILEDATVPRSKLADMVRAINKIADKYDVQICTFGHAGDGNLHPTCVTDSRDEAEIHRVEQAFEDIFATALEMGGTITGEHGVGVVKSPYLEWKLGESGIAVMKSLKQALDPTGIMNPGKVFAKASRKRIVIGA
ncbi:glycolate oxidase subunit GlcD [Caldalkalibacillus salinus]|uniref:glycolate oxidase subunit GlcD n=1 Tax=Caldalkalibacillus salinus TaxID=2803787 RepID=UPI001921AB0D|nr:glycolate oxidase subunit GlcD [Caldalkalibacillus salinus]